MKIKWSITWSIVAVLLLALGVSLSQAQTPVNTAFTYQGQLKQSGAPINGNCDFQFRLYDAVSGGTQIGTTQTKTGVVVSGGLFTIPDLDFGASAFRGDARWLEIGVRCPTGSGTYTTLSPRQALTAAPYALGLRPGTVVSGTVGSLGAVFYARNTSASAWNAVVGETDINIGVYGISRGTTGAGVYGDALATSGANYGVVGQSASTDGYGVLGRATATSGVNYGVRGISQSNIGVYGTGYATNSAGVYGDAPAASGVTYGVVGRSASTAGRGVFGLADAASGNTYGVVGQSASTNGTGVIGYATATSGNTYGVVGQSASTDGRGVYGYATATSGTTYGVVGRSDSTNGYGVYGSAFATSGVNYGVYGRSASTAGYGVLGWATATSGFTYGVVGMSDSPNGTGVYGYAPNADSSVGPGYAGYFFGDVRVTNDFSVGGSKAFKIDHPLAPAERYLYHFAQEAPEVQNIYNGVVTLNANGEATVRLPAYFSALNAGPFRYQLTAIGAPMPNLHIAQEIVNGAFRIAGGIPGQKVSWEVTAVRNDPYLRDHPPQAEVDKPAAERGTYLYPQGYGQPAEKGLDYRHTADLRRPVDQPAVEPPEKP